MLVVAVPFFVYRQTGSSTATAVVFAAEAIPQVVLGPFAGVLVDRVDRGTALVVANVAAAVTVLGLLLADAWDLLPVLYATVLVQSCITQVLVPARNALLPELVAMDDLATANGLDQVSDSAVRLVAPALGGVLLAASGLMAPVVIDAATFAVAAVVLLPLRRRRAKEERRTEDVESVLRALFDGLRVTLHNPAARTVCVAFFAAIFGQGLLNVAFVAVVSSFGGAAAYGSVIAAQGVGALAGSLVSHRVVRRLGTETTIIAAFAVAAVLVGVYATIRSVPLAVGMSLLIGIAAVQILVAGQTLLQSGVDTASLGRVSGVVTCMMAMGLLAGLAVAAVISPVVGPRTSLGVAACSLAVAGAATALLGTSSRRVAPPVSL